MATSSLRIALPVSICLLIFNGTAWGQSSEAKTSSWDDVHFFLGERLWVATWQQPMFDAQVVVPSGANPTPVVQTHFTDALSSSTVMPMTVLGGRMGNWTLSTSIIPSTSFSTSAAIGGKVRRDEADFSLAYSVLPNVAASIVYKIGKVDSGSTAQAAALVGNDSGFRINGLLLGVSASAPLQGSLAVYGNAAYGPAHEKVDAGGTYSMRYRIAEFGFAYRFDDERMMLGVKSVTLQLGYRVQIVNVAGVPEQTFSTVPPPTLLATRNTTIQSTTQGPVVAMLASF